MKHGIRGVPEISVLVAVIVRRAWHLIKTGTFSLYRWGLLRHSFMEQTGRAPRSSSMPHYTQCAEMISQWHYQMDYHDL